MTLMTENLHRSLALFNERDVPEILAEQGGYLKCVSQREDSGFEPQLGSF